MLDDGIYTLTDVARYAKLPPATVRSWFKPRPDLKHQRPLFQSDIKPVSGDYAVSFLNLIEARAAAAFRAKGVPSNVIRKSHDRLKEKLKTPHPFAHSDLRVGHKRIIEWLNQDDALVMRDAITNQQLLEFAAKYLDGVTYDVRSKMADKWEIRPGVMLVPGVAFGRSVLSGTGLSTYVLASQYEANERDADLVADLFYISADQVRAAVTFESWLHAARAG